MSGFLDSMYLMQSFFPGGHGARVIPVPFPNTEVKTRCGDGTASLGGGRVARCQDFFTEPICSQIGSFFCAKCMQSFCGVLQEQCSGVGNFLAMETFCRFFHSMERARSAHGLPKGKSRRDEGHPWTEATVVHAVETFFHAVEVLNS
jgi:hypothetical protein